MSSFTSSEYVNWNGSHAKCPKPSMLAAKMTFVGVSLKFMNMSFVKVEILNIYSKIICFEVWGFLLRISYTQHLPRNEI